MQAHRRTVPSLAAVALLALVAAGVVVLGHSPSSKGFEYFAFGIAGVSLAAACLLVIDPAWTLSGCLVLSVFSGNWGNMHIPIPLDRLAFVLGLGAVLVQLARARSLSTTKVRPVCWLWALVIVYAVGSAAAVDTLTSHDPLYALLDRLGVVPLALYFLAPRVFATERQRDILLGSLVALGAYLGVTSLLEVIGPKSLVLPQYINNPALGIHADRARGPFLEAGANGLAMFSCAVAAATGLTRWRSPAARRVAYVVIALSVAGVVMTLTRQVWLGAIVGLLLAMLADRRLRRLIVPASLAVALAVVAVLVLVPGLSQKVNTRLNDQSSLWDRLNSDGAALRMIEAKPLTGFGWGTFATASPPYYRLAAHYPLSAVAEVHSDVLSNAVELGLPATFLWLAVLVIALLGPMLRRGPPGTQPWRLGLIAIGVAWFVQSNFTPLDYAYDNYIVWVWAALVSAESSWSGVAVRARRGVTEIGGRLIRQPMPAHMAVASSRLPALPAGTVPIAIPSTATGMVADLRVGLSAGIGPIATLEPSPTTQVGGAPLSHHEIRQRATSGAVSIMARGLGVRGIGLLGNLVLARLLLPREFGMVALGVTIMTIGDYVAASGGLGAALIRQPGGIDRADLRAIFGFQLLVTIAICAAVTAIGIQLGTAGALAAIMVWALVIDTGRAPNAIPLERGMHYGPIVKAEVIETIAWNVCAVVAVAAGLGVWGVAVAQIVRALVGYVTLSLQGPLGFIRPRFAWSPVRRLLPFGMRFQGFGMLMQLRDQGMSIGIAAVGGFVALGVWSIVYRLALVVGVLLESLWRVSFPAMSRLRESGAEVGPVVERAVSAACILSGFLVVPLAGAAPALIPVLFGRSWDAAIDVMPLAAAAIMLSGPLAAVAVGYLLAEGRGHVLIRMTALDALAMAGGLPLLHLIGVVGLGFGALASGLIDFLVLTGTLWRRQSINAFTPTLIPMAAMIGGSALAWVATVRLGHGVESLLASVVAGESAYALFLILFRRSALIECVRIVLRTTERRRRHGMTAVAVDHT